MRAASVGTVVALLQLACSPPPNPVVEGNRVTLFIESTGDVAPSVTGDFTQWKPQPATRMPRGDWYRFDTVLEEDARVEYLLQFGPSDLRLDPRNERRVPSVGGDASEVVMPAAETQPELAIGDAPAHGAFDERAFAISGGSHRVVVYRPAEMSRPLPIVYFHDGSLLIDKGKVPQILDKLVQSGKVQPLVAVFVDPVSRVDDYKANPAFRRWFIEVLVPQVEATIGSRPPARAVVGVSRGAAAALDLAWHHPEIFSRCGLLIPSTSPTDLSQQIDRAPAKPIRFAVITGRYDVEWLEEGRTLRRVLERKGYSITYREVPEGHNVQTWRAHLDDVLIGLGLGV